jgi:hypothetical protein
MVQFLVLVQGPLNRTEPDHGSTIYGALFEQDVEAMEDESVCDVSLEE